MPFSLNGERIVKARTATARLPNYATARRRGCRTARLPSGAWALRARLLSVSGFCDGRTAFPRRHFGHRVALNVARPSAEGRLRLSAGAPFGSRAVWQSRGCRCALLRSGVQELHCFIFPPMPVFAPTGSRGEVGAAISALGDEVEDGVWSAV